MLAKAYLDFRTRLDQEGAVLTYCGFVSESVLTALGETLKRKMAESDTDANTMKRVFSVFIEQVQNIIRYSGERLQKQATPPGMGGGLIMVGTEGDQYFVVCANFIAEDRVERLRGRLEHLLTLDKDAIRVYYREKLREPPEDDSLGATVGLIEIARRSSRPLQYDFHPTPDGKSSFFCLKAYI
ncbi:MAG TPA: SiaB family protein kinase [Stellaceae bacterium]|nr:SiaB family protein kinase [Stellaceae bacterium]